MGLNNQRKGMAMETIEAVTQLRREAVANLATVINAPVLAKAFGVSLRTIELDKEITGANTELARQRARALTWRRAAVQALVDAGHRASEIAELISATKSEVREDMKALGLSKPDGKKRRSPLVLQRQALVAELHKNLGLGPVAIARATGLTLGTVTMDLASMGLVKRDPSLSLND